ncbi:MAG TPA: patatin-like phospholipase family protein [Patescibacteria group bacterium]|nr:patatin-like phospholipase family protein [Patescibacteria group bacterium]
MMSHLHIVQEAGGPALGAPLVEPEPATRNTRDGDPPGGLGLVLTGGGARAVYQVGVLRGLTRRLPKLHFDVVTGVSAGAINATYLAARSGPLARDVEGLKELWRSLTLEDVVRVDASALWRNVVRWGARLVSGGGPLAPPVHGLVDTSPLRRLLERVIPEDDGGAIAGLEENLIHGRLKAVAVSSHDYANGQTVTWVAGAGAAGWNRPVRRSAPARLTIDHVLASAALPILFPAVQLGGHWHGDGGIRQSAPLSPALHLGARRILAISTRHASPLAEPDPPRAAGYPPPAQILGQMIDAAFLDAVDEDAFHLERSNDFLRGLSSGQRRGYHPIDVAVIRPSQDLGRIAALYEPGLPRAFRFLTRGLGTRGASNAGFLSLLMFVPEYAEHLIALGETDAEARLADVARLAGLRDKEGIHVDAIH